MPRSRPSGEPGRRLIRHWRVFRPGRWNGEPWTERDLREMAENFHRFRQPVNSPDPFYIPFVSINHADGTMGLANGEVRDCGLDPDGWFWVDFAVDDAVAQALDAGQLPGASIEWWNTRIARDRELSNFPATPDGRPVGLVLRALTLCGAMAPAVKGQPRPPRSQPLDEPLPQPWRERFGHWIQRFTDPDPPERVFVEIPNVEKLVQQFLALNPGLTPEQAEQLAYAAGEWFVQQSGGSATPTVDSPAAGAIGADAGAQPAASGPPMDEPPTGPPTASVAPPPDGMAGDRSACAPGAPGEPMVQKFADLAAQLDAQRTRIADLEQRLTAAGKQREADDAAASDRMVQTFADAVRTSKKATPAETERLLKDLRQLSPAARDVQIAVLSRQYGLGAAAPPPADRQFRDEAAAPRSDSGFLELMSLTPTGRHILAQKAAAAASRN